MSRKHLILVKTRGLQNSKNSPNDLETAIFFFLNRQRGLIANETYIILA